MLVAAGQLGPASDRSGETVARVTGLLGEAAGRGVALVCFPELALTPYFAVRSGADVEAISLEGADGPREAIQTACREAGVWAILPVAEREGRSLYNSVIAVSPTGDVVGRYRKVHIPSGFTRADGRLSGYERTYFTPGSEYAVWDTGEYRVGALVCYDRFFPEAGRIVAQMGADVICYPSNNRAYGSGWAREAWETLIRARAYENGCFAIAPGKAGEEGGEPFLGDSFIASPLGGQVLARAETDGDELVVAELDHEEIAQARARFNFARDRRPDTYGLLAR